MTAVKICGVRRVDDALTAVRAGADMLGFVFAPSRRRVSPEEARDIIAEVRRVDGARAHMVGVFVNASPAEINRTARLAGLDVAQLSGDEGNDVVEALGIPTIKVLHIGKTVPPQTLRDRADASSAEMLLLDTARAGAYGGTGEVFDWTVIPDLGKPVLVAGGLNAGNVARAIRTVRPWGVDVSGGVETNGEKNQEKIVEFISVVKNSAQPRGAV